MEKEFDFECDLDNIVPALSETEARVILAVIERDEELRQRDQARIMKLKAELQALRKKGAINSLLDSDPNQERTCARCRTEFGRLINRGASCRVCRLHVCKSCRELDTRTTEWICCVCQKRKEVQAASGEWMYEFERRPSEKQDENSYDSAAEGIKKSVKRSWTISNPSHQRCRETEQTGNVRTYNSLPRHKNSEESEILELSQQYVRNSAIIREEGENIKKKRENIMKAKSKSLSTSDRSTEEDTGGAEHDNDSEIMRVNSDKKMRYKSQKLKMKIKRQASLEEQYPLAAGSKEEAVPKVEKGPNPNPHPNPNPNPNPKPDPNEEVGQKPERKLQFFEDLKIPKIEIMRKNSLGETFRSVKEYTISSPNSSKLRERFSRSKLFKEESNNLSVELSKSSDSGIGVSRSTEDDPIKTSESFVFRFFDVGNDTRLNKSDSERSPNFLETVGFFSWSRSQDRSVSSDSSDKNLSDIDKPSIKIRKRRHFSESRDSSSSYEGNMMDPHISNRVRKIHEVALKQMSEENARGERLQKRSVEFKHAVEYGSYESIPTKTEQMVSKLRKFKSLERTDSGGRTCENLDSDEKNSSGESSIKSKFRFKSKRGSLSQDRKKEKKCKGILKSRKNVEGDESGENVGGQSDSREEELEAKEEVTKRLSRKDKKSPKKTKRALSEEHRRSNSKAKERSLFFSFPGFKRRSHSEKRRERREMSEEDDNKEEKETEKTYRIVPDYFQTKNDESQGFSRMRRALNWTTPKKIYSTQKQRTDFLAPKVDVVDRGKTGLDFVEIGSYLEVMGKIMPVSDDYKIVFISSDSSTKENRSISSDSESGSTESCESGTDSSKKLASDCDWDYFESSSVVRPVLKDWSWCSSPKSFTGTLFERSSPVFSTSDDNSPKFPRRSLSKFSVRDSPISCDGDAGGFSPNLKRKLLDLDEAKFQRIESPQNYSPVPNVEANEDSHTEEKEIEITDLKASPPLKSKEFSIIKEPPMQHTELSPEPTSLELKFPEENRKPKKKRKSRKSKKGGIAKDEDVLDSPEVKDNPTGSVEEETPTENAGEKETNTTEEDLITQGGPVERDSLGLNEEREEAVCNTSVVSPDGVNTVSQIAESVEKQPVSNSQAVVRDNSAANKDATTKSKGKNKKPKNKKKGGDKRGSGSGSGSGLPKSESGTESLCNAVQNEFVAVEANPKPGADRVPDEFTLQSGNFGFQSQNLVSSQTQYPEVISYNCPISNLLQNSNVIQNLVPIPIPVPIPVPFPVPAAIWAQNCQNFYFPNFSFGSENFELFNNLQNLYAASYLHQNLGNSTRNDNKEVSFKPEETNSNGTGNGSIHIRPINMQRPALAIGSLPGWSQGSVNSAVSDPNSCLTGDDQHSPDKAETVITKESVVGSNESEDVIVADGEKTTKNFRNKKSKRSKRKSKSLTDKNSILELREGGSKKGSYDGDMVSGSEGIPSGKPVKNKSDLDLPNVFVEGKTFRDVKNILKHKSDMKPTDDCLPSETQRNKESDTVEDVIRTIDNNNRDIILVDETVTCELIESSLLNIDKKSEYSSTSNSEDSDGEQPKKPFKKSYYFNLGDAERKTSDDSDIADLSSTEEEIRSEDENSSHGDSSGSEDEGNPETRFSEVYVVNTSESETDLTKLAEEGNDSKTRKEGKKFRESYLLSEDTDSDSRGDSNVVLIKHVKKLTEEDNDNVVEIPPKTKVTDCEEKVEAVVGKVSDEEAGFEPEIWEKSSNTGEPENLHNSEKSGENAEIRSEDPVTLVKHLTEDDSSSASVAQSEIVPGSLAVLVVDNNSSEPVFSEIGSVPCDSVEGENVDVCSLLSHSGDELISKDSKILEKDTVHENDECKKSLFGGDVNHNAESEVINGDLLGEPKPCSNASEGNEDGVDVVTKSESSNSKDLEGNQNGLSFLDKIESRIRHFTQLESLGGGYGQEKETKYTSLVMITQEKNDKSKLETNNLDNTNSVKVITTNTTKVLDSESLEQFDDEICLKHTNRKSEEDDLKELKLKSFEDYYTMTLENSRGLTVSPKKPNVIKNMTPLREEDEVEGDSKEEVQVVTDDKTLSAVICLEEGLADDDSWVEDLEKDRENDFVSTITEDDSSDDDTPIGACIPIHTDREEELRGYHRGAINFTLHTIVEESCEESEVEDKNKSVVTKKPRPTSATDLEKYFYFDIGGGVNPSFESQDLDTFSESSSSIYSDGGVIDDNSGEVRETSDQTQLSTSRLEKYFLNFDRDGREKESDGSVGSDSEGPPSPEQRRKRLFRARASNRLHSSSLDNLVQSENEQQSMDMILDSEDSSTETDMPDPQNIDKSDDSVKRKKKRKISGGSLNVPLIIQEGTDKKVVLDNEGVKESRESLTREHRHREMKEEVKDTFENEDSRNFDNESDDERSKTPQPDFGSESGMIRDKQQSRDSGFIGSCDDLLKDQKTGGDSSGSDTKKKGMESSEKSLIDQKEAENQSSTVNRQQSSGMLASTPPATGLTRKDSFNNWSSDEETNLMMSKMRQFFKAMVSVPKTSNKVPENSNPSSPQVKTKGVKPPQLVYFENELTRLMKTVPGIRDDQVREIVEYLSSEDTWSDSYDSSDYTSSDLEGTAAYYQRSQLQQEISESCKQIIDNFDQSKTDQEHKPKVPPRRNSSPMNRETAFVYQKLVASFNKITNENENASTSPHSSPPLFAKVMHHIGSRLVALMHEVSSNSSGEGSISSHKARYHKRISQKLSNVSSTTEEECGLTDESDYKAEDATAFHGQNLPYFQLLHQLPRSKSHDLLLEEAKVKSLRSSSSGVSDIAEEKEASDYERFSWRGSFESALMADSRSKLTLLSNDSHSSNTALAAKRRSAGDLLFLKSLSREQLDRVRSCGSIGGVAMEDKNIWTTGRDRNGRRRSSVPDAASLGSGASADGDEDSSDSEIIQERSITLPRNLQSIVSSQNTNSLPRLPTTGATNTQNLSKAQSVQHFLPNAKSARYRPPGFNRIIASSPKRAVSAPGLQVPQPSHARRERRRNQNYQANNPSLSVDELTTLDSSTTSSPHSHGGSKSANPSPIVGSAKSRLRRGASSVGSSDWPTDEIQRLVALDQQRQSSSSLGARSDSMASVYSGAGEGRSCSIPVKGEVEFGLQYNYKAGDLEIYVKQCKDLAAVDTKRNRSDPYVKVYLLPDKSKSGKRKTKVKKHTLNPVFDEILKFHISLNGLETRTLWLTVWHSDMFGRNDFLGEVMMSLENKVFDDPTPQSYTLQERTEPFEDILSYKGDIIIGLKFVPPDAISLQKKGKRSKGALNVKVKEAKNLTAVKSNGVSDPFCKSYLLPDKGRNSKQKTPVQRRTCNPSWNHTFVYEDVSLQELSERCLELTVWDHDRLASNEFLGGLRFSLGSGKHYGKPVDWMDSTGKEVLLWQSMLEKPNLWVEGCLPLRASLDPPNSIS